MTTPDDLQLEPASADVKRYQRHKIWTAIASTIVGLSGLIFFAVVAGPILSGWLTEVVGTSAWVRLIAMAAIMGLGLEVLTLPLDFYSSYLLEHEHQLSNQTLGGWIRRKLKSYLVGGILGVLLLSGLYALLWMAGDYWWIWATAGWLLVSLVLGQLLPILILPLFFKVTRLEDDGLLQRLKNLTMGTTLTVEGVYRLELSKETKKANAALAGLGKTRRVLLGDTLLEQFSPEEIEVVFAHEVGHHVHRHIPKMIALRVLLTLCGFWLVDALLTQVAPALGYAHFTDPAALPLVLLTLALFGLLLAPLQNALSRFFERQCDRYALERTGNRTAYRSAFIKLARINKANPDPHPFLAWLLYDHPPIRERLALADLA